MLAARLRPGFTLCPASNSFVDKHPTEQAQFAVAADAELPAGLRVAYAYALPIAGVAGESGCSANVGAVSSMESGGVGPVRARKTKRMDRRLTHWQCTFCRHETPQLHGRVGW